MEALKDHIFTDLRNAIEYKDYEALERFVEEHIALREKVNSTDQKLLEIKFEIKELTLSMREGFKQNAIKFEAVDKQFKAVDKRFEDLIYLMDKRFEAVDKYFESVYKRFESVDKRFESVDKRFESVDKRFDIIEKRLSFQLRITIILFIASLTILGGLMTGLKFLFE